MAPQHLGTFEGARKRGERGRFDTPEQSFAQDVASLVAMAAFVVSACFVLVAAFGPGMPV